MWDILNQMANFTPEEAQRHWSEEVIRGISEEDAVELNTAFLESLTKGTKKGALDYRAKLKKVQAKYKK